MISPSTPAADDRDHRELYETVPNDRARALGVQVASLTTALHHRRPPQVLH